jgi:hypothetical protein
MKNLKNDTITTMATLVQSIKGWRALFTLGLAAAFTALSAVGPAQVALADEGGAKGHTFDVTFTIWMTALPANPPSRVGVPLAGGVGGAVGDGRFAGRVLSDNLTVPGFWLGEDQFEFHGEEHSFIADVHIKHDTKTGLAVITGVVTHGWLKGAHLTGEYTTIPVCPIATPGNVFGTLCFQGALHIHRGGESEE